MGMPDLDDVFKLATPKFVYIRDRYLGLLKYFFMACIFGYVVVFDIMYSGNHLVPHHAGGYGTISMEHPVKSCTDRSCTNKYENIGDLKYCKQFGEVGTKRELLLSKGNGKKDAEEDGRNLEGLEVGDFITKPRTCRYIDNDRLTLEETPNQIFVPTRYVSYTQKMNTDCYDPLLKGHTGQTPRKEHTEAAPTNYGCKKAWETTDTNEFFVADIGDFTLSFQHSFMAPDIGLAGVSTDYKGFMAACTSNHPRNTNKECKRMEVPNTVGDVAPEDRKGTIQPTELGIHSLKGTPEGFDQIEFKDLLRLTPIARNNSWDKDIPDLKLPRDFGHPETSIRESGGMLMLSVSYENMGPMRPGIPGIDMPSFLLGAIKPITYTYRPYFIPTQSNKRVEVLQESDSSTSRVVNVWYGVTVQMSFEGQVVVFSFSQLLHGFTTGLVLLSSATSIVVALAIYVFPHKEKYLLQMYQYTEDMSDYKSLPHDKLDVTSHTGKYLHDARKATGSESSELTNQQITDILVDYEIRLNRIDGRDPKLAFIDGSDPEGSVAFFRGHHKVHKDKFINDCKRVGGGGGGAE